MMKVRRTHRSWLSVLTAAVALLPVLATSSANSNNDNNNKGMISIPLVSHQVQQERLRNRRRRLGDEDWEELPERPSQYNHRRRSRSLNDDGNMQVAALFQGYGTHYADLWCGTPPQRQTVIVDTGSGVTAFPCVGCDPVECGVPKYHLDSLFDGTASSTYRELACSECLRGHCNGGMSNGKCSMGMSYQEGSSWSATEVEDHCYVGGLHKMAVQDDHGKDDLDPFHAPAFSFPLKFGCQTRLTGLFKTQLADGIMGMDQAKAAFWNQMSSQQNLDIAQKFSLCFSRSPTASRDGTGAGAMTLGGTDERLHESDIIYTAVDASSRGAGFFSVHLRKMYLRKGGGESAKSSDPNAQTLQVEVSEEDLNRGNVIVDSGTTDTYFSRRLGTPFKNAWMKVVGEAYSHSPVELTEEELNDLPTVLFQMKGNEELNKQIVELNGGRAITGLAGDLDPENPYDVIVAMPASHIYEYDIRNKKYTARFYVEEGSGGVLGANAMMGHDVFFDVENHRIGWAESTCDYYNLVQPYVDGKTTDSSRKEHPKQIPGESTESPDESTPSSMGDSPSSQGNPAAQPLAFCSETSCWPRFVIVGVLAVAVLVAVRAFRRRSVSYQVASLQSELELQSAGPSEDSDEDGDFSNIRYRDHPEGTVDEENDTDNDNGDEEEDKEIGVLS